MLKYVLLLTLMLLLFVPVTACAAPTNMPIVLISDFGTDDYRVPRLKGVIYSANPEAQIIDGTHGIGASDIAAGAYVLGLTAAEFPEKVVFLGAVGAGSTPDEKTLVVVNDKDQLFVLPDNGLVTFVAMNMGVKKAYAVTNEKLFDKPMAGLSSHQILGKIAARLAGGYKAADVGPEASPVMLKIQDAGVINGKLTGYIVFIDHFGNCLTNISQEDTTQFGLKAGDTIKITANGVVSTSVIGTRYGDVPVGGAVSMVNSLGVLQLSINRGSFATTNGVKTGMMVEIEKAAP
jgi:S-adenosyl-L-methionine hydrolase (adenosine-forming)